MSPGFISWMKSPARARAIPSCGRSCWWLFLLDSTITSLSQTKNGPVCPVYVVMLWQTSLWLSLSQKMAKQQHENDPKDVTQTIYPQEKKDGHPKSSSCCSCFCPPFFDVFLLVQLGLVFFARSIPNARNRRCPAASRRRDDQRRGLLFLVFPEMEIGCYDVKNPWKTIKKNIFYWTEITEGFGCKFMSILEVNLSNF